TALTAPEPAQIPFWLRSQGNPNPGSFEVFNAFHSKSGPLKLSPSVPGPMMPGSGPAIYPLEFRTFTGAKNNDLGLGTVFTPFLRTTTIGYGDGVGSPGGADQLGAREISNLVSAQSDVIPNTDNISSFVWQWGQFADHDISFTAV